ncbi:MAG TPA: hypothetical protein P5079_01980 [Elusimicrobiota bacterium]|nr:hypothetical protein [Elusimicrobiota bacterium]
MAERRTIEISCPCCQAVLTVDAETGDVLLHKEAKKKVEMDIAKAAQALKDDVSRRDDIFRKSIEAQKRKGGRLDKQFEEGLRRAKEEPETPRLREIDLD